MVSKRKKHRLILLVLAAGLFVLGYLTTNIWATPEGFLCVEMTNIPLGSNVVWRKQGGAIPFSDASTMKDAIEVGRNIVFDYDRISYGFSFFPLAYKVNFVPYPQGIIAREADSAEIVTISADASLAQKAQKIWRKCLFDAYLAPSRKEKDE